MKHKMFLFLALAVFSIGCKEEVLPKPKAMLRLEYPKADYQTADTDCVYTFDQNSLSNIKENKDCSLVLDYPMMKGSIYLTYKPVQGNLDTLLVDAQKLSYEHVVKADNIVEQPFINQEDGVYGMFYEVSGNAASQSQFYVTDSTDHFVTGSLYFYAKPNYDSILPAAMYLQNDIRRIMESLRWKE
ncbi:gliding motility lipoprotein GldD [Allomuricauda sp.]|jgi:gliding motility-associated lipoprotein GldD|uniref:gliding motility lipoprotein GldD n=1 Tax=Flagellimonas sp. TaxID=2058762 RepID=UPI001B0A4CCE|nr:gliding motility lipoprotein GldD [Allomuricauda sp.]MBO6533180.1 gliding motility lipoprotein GldD [Allomuricauda sp.]MBO6587755.1 gliding motility lipoprotein GldD [Allomuricauda sp.]MBO6617380.1 gliding motility lipoprotein GldD [Allomuricauda sp.]MBO6643609.1 gliding motility lipoprotein GldD [Allomuricauda sp.]MBO6745715.1 gliding motility lipoprotein GldD [Allomuricauda sp.]